MITVRPRSHGANRRGSGLILDWLFRLRPLSVRQYVGLEAIQARRMRAQPIRRLLQGTLAQGPEGPSDLPRLETEIVQHCSVPHPGQPQIEGPSGSPGFRLPIRDDQEVLAVG